MGTAGTYSGLILAEHPLPWPSDMSEVNAFAGLAAEAARNNTRLQALVPAGGPQIVRYHRPDGPFAGFATSDIAESAILICTHGKRDVCCGSLGSALWSRLPEIDRCRTWRTSHLGGHRFAPTALVLPEGTAWAHLDAELLLGIVNRSIEIEDALPHFRGCMGLGREAQVVDREALRSQGWDWLDTTRSEEVISRTDGRVDVRLRTNALAYTAVLEVARMLPVPDCGSDTINKYVPEYRVISFERTY